jgi:DNA-binding SARP family transcriptional activator
MYEIRLFGPLQVRTRGIRLTGHDFGGDEPRHILALLALRGELSPDVLTDLLWDGQPPADHRQAVRDHVAMLRHRLDPDASAADSVIATTRGGYALVADRVRVDVARFDELIAAAGRRTAVRALPPLVAAAHVADRPLLAGESPAWADSARQIYRIRLREALLQAAAHSLDTMRVREALSLTERALGLYPGDERGARMLTAVHQHLAERFAGERFAVPA